MTSVTMQCTSNVHPDASILLSGLQPFNSRDQCHYNVRASLFGFQKMCKQMILRTHFFLVLGVFQDLVENLAIHKCFEYGQKLWHILSDTKS